MNRVLATALADGLLIGMVCGLPILWMTFRLRMPGGLDARQHATILAAATGGGVLLGVPGAAIIGTAALLAFALAWLSARYALVSVFYDRSIAPPRLFPDDEADLVLRLENRKLLPLAWITVEEPLWTDLQRSRAKIEQMLKFSTPLRRPDRGGGTVHTEGAVGAFRTLELCLRFTALQRGVYTVGPARLTSGDPFGLFPREFKVGGVQDIVVYPRIHQPEALGLPMREALGQLVAQRALVEDPTLIAGSREYRPGDPLRRVHWKSTAKRNALQVRVADPSTTAQIMVVLNLNAFHHIWEGVETERMEVAISVAASLAVWALDRGFAVGVHSNGMVTGAESNSKSPRIPPSAHPEQASLLLEHLARLSFAGIFSPERILYDEALHLRANTSILLVTPTITHELTTVFQMRRLAGRLTVVYCGRRAAPIIPGIPIHLAVPSNEVRRAAS